MAVVRSISSRRAASAGLLLLSRLVHETCLAAPFGILTVGNCIDASRNVHTLSSQALMECGAVDHFMQDRACHLQYTSLSGVQHVPMTRIAQLHNIPSEAAFLVCGNCSTSYLCQNVNCKLSKASSSKGAACYLGHLPIALPIPSKHEPSPSSQSYSAANHVFQAAKFVFSVLTAAAVAIMNICVLLFCALLGLLAITTAAYHTGYAMPNGYSSETSTATVQMPKLPVVSESYMDVRSSQIINNVAVSVTMQLPAPITLTTPTAITAATSTPTPQAENNNATNQIKPGCGASKASVAGLRPLDVPGCLPRQQRESAEDPVQHTNDTENTNNHRAEHRVENVLQKIPPLPVKNCEPVHDVEPEEQGACQEESDEGLFQSTRHIAPPKGKLANSLSVDEEQNTFECRSNPLFCRKVAGRMFPSYSTTTDRSREQAIGDQRLVSLDWRNVVEPSKRGKASAKFTKSLLPQRTSSIMATPRVTLAIADVSGSTTSTNTTRMQGTTAETAIKTCLPSTPTRPSAASLTVQQYHEEANGAEAEPENGDDAGKYLKMLSVGIPLEAVVHKMRSEGVTSTVIDDVVRFKSGTTTAAPRTSHSDTDAEKNALPLVATAVALAPPSVAAIFGQGARARPAPPSSQELRSFSGFGGQAQSRLPTPLTTPSSAVSAVKGQKKVSLLDSKRSTNAGIALAKVRLPGAIVCRALEELNPHLRCESLQETGKEYNICANQAQLVSSQLLPSESEKECLNRYLKDGGDVSQLAEVERFFSSVAMVSDAAARCQILLDRVQYQQIEKEVIGRAHLLCGALDAACTYPFLEVVQAGRDLVEACDPCAPKTQISLKALTTSLRTTKSADKLTHLLDYFLSQLQVTAYWDAFQSARDRMDRVSSARNTDFSESRVDNTTIDGMLKRLQKASILLQSADPVIVQAFRVYEEDCTRCLRHARAASAEAWTRYQSALTLWHESSSLPPNDFFRTVHEFLHMLRAAADAADAKARRAATEAARATTAHRSPHTSSAPHRSPHAPSAVHGVTQRLTHSGSGAPVPPAVPKPGGPVGDWREALKAKLAERNAREN